MAVLVEYEGDPAMPVLWKCDGDGGGGRMVARKDVPQTELPVLSHPFFKTLLHGYNWGPTLATCVLCFGYVFRLRVSGLG